MKDTRKNYDWIVWFAGILRVFFGVPTVKCYFVPSLEEGVTGAYDPKTDEIKLSHEFWAHNPKFVVARTLVHEFTHAWAWAHHHELSLLFNVYGDIEGSYWTKACLSEETARQMSVGNDIRAIYPLLEGEEAFMTLLRHGECHHELIVLVVEIALKKGGAKVPQVILDQIKEPDPCEE